MNYKLSPKKLSPLSYWLVLLCLNLVYLSSASAQKSDGTVASLIKTEQYFHKIAVKNGLNNAFVAMAAKRGVVFAPEPKNIIAYYATQEQESLELIQQPELAMIAKSGYFGFTTGLYTLKDADKISYGHYLSIWEAGKNKKWTLALYASMDHPQPNENLKAQYIDPLDYKYPIFIGPKKIKMREDIVFSTDELFGKALKKTGNKNFNEYYADDVRLYFPGQLPKLGKTAAIGFIDQRNQHVTSYPNFKGRAISGDLAYTNGKATIGVNQYNYVRVWKIGDDMKWYVLIDMYLDEPEIID